MSYSTEFNNSFPQPKEEILDMQSYSAPLENRRDLIRLDFNENTIGPSPKVLEVIKSIQLNEISIYPEYDLLKKNICKNYFEKKILNINEIGIFNGADAAINAIFNCFGKRNEIFLTTNPTFGYYFPCAEIQGMKILTCSYEGTNFLFPLNKFKHKIKQYKPKLVFICNPNNPTGSILGAKEIINLANNNPKSLFVIDELYEKFYGDSLLNHIEFQKTKNIIIIQSLSKTAGLAGLRIGFAFGNRELIKFIKKVTGPYDVNSIAVKAAIAALEDKEYIDEYVSKVKEARTWILNKFKGIDIRSNFSGGNYFLLWPNICPEILAKEMKRKGILIRSMANKKDIENSVRVSIGTKNQMSLFWEAYKDLDK